MKRCIVKLSALFTVATSLLGACGNPHHFLGMRQEDSQRGSIARSSNGCVYTATTQSDSPLYYVMEKVGQDNVEKWRKYANDEEQLCYRLCHALDYYKNDHERLTALGRAHLVPYEEVLRATRDPLPRFKECLTFHDREGVEVWVAYATCQNPTAGGAISDMSNVEMSVAVLTHVDAPFQLHMGISRGVSFLEQKKLVHKGIAVGLHAFAAKAMRQSGQKNHYLITTPVKRMAEILKQQLPGGTWWEGNNDGTSPIQQTGNGYHDDALKFQLFDKQRREIIFEADYGQASSSHLWFFFNIQTPPHSPYFIVDIDALCAHNL